MIRGLQAHPALLWAVIALACAVLIFGGHHLIAAIEMTFELQRLAATNMLNHPAVYAMLAIYILLLAFPFMPGAELGFMLLMVFGGQIAGHVYLATVLALVLSFGIGRLVPKARLIAGLKRIGLRRASAMLASHRNPSDPLLPNAPPAGGFRQWIIRMMRHRCIALALLLNMPGNTLLGGGGGISMAAGASRIMTPKAFLVTVILGVAPIPLSFAVTSFFGS